MLRLTGVEQCIESEKINIDDVDGREAREVTVTSAPVPV